MQEKSHTFLNGFALKLIAVITMTIDHIGYVFMPGTQYYSLFRGIGRIAFPIFCFLIVEGFHHTKSPLNYLLRLCIFALISEVPFDLAFFKTPFNWNNQNVFFTLALGLSCLFCLEEMNTKKWYAGIMLALFAIAYLIHCDYGPGGVLLICMFYLTEKSPWVQFILAGLIFYIFFGAVELYGLIGMLFIMFYNGKRGYNKAQWFFYMFYPLHLMILYGIYVYV